MDVKVAKVAALTVLDQIGLLDESDDDDDDETTFVVAIGTLLALPSPRVKVYGYIETVVPNYLDPVFKRFFRMSRYVFELLVDYLREVPEMKTTPGGLEPIPLEK